MSNFLMRIGSKSGVRSVLEFDPTLSRPTYEELALVVGSLINCVDIEGMILLRDLIESHISSELNRFTDKLLNSKDLVIIEEEDEPGRPPESIDDL